LRLPAAPAGGDVMRGRVLVALLGLVALPARAEERAEADLRRLFPQQAAVFVVPPGGLARLKVPAEVLAAVGPDLSDLRLFDRRGREVPYVIDTGPDARTRVEVKETAEAAILDVQRQEIRRDDGPPRQRESYALAAPATAPQAGAWELVFRTDRLRFVRRVDITAEAPDGGTRRIVENGSLFRLPNIAKDKTRVTLPPLAGGRLSVTLEGEDGFYLEPRLVFESARFLDPSEEASVPLQELARRPGEGRTILELARPRGLVPDVLRLETETPAFDRAVEVCDLRAGGRGVLPGRASLVGVEGGAAGAARDVARG